MAGAASFLLQKAGAFMIRTLFVVFIVLALGQLTGLWSIATGLLMLPLYLIAFLFLAASLLAIVGDLYEEFKHRGGK